MRTCSARSVLPEPVDRLGEGSAGPSCGLAEHLAASPIATDSMQQASVVYSKRKAAAAAAVVGI